MSGFQPFAYVIVRGGRPRPRTEGSQIKTWGEQQRRIQAVCVRNPAHPSRSDPGHAGCNSVALAQLCRAIFEQASQRPIYISKTEEAEVVGADLSPSTEFQIYKGGGETPPRPPELPYPITVVCSGLILYSTRTSPGWP